MSVPEITISVPCFLLVGATLVLYVLGIICLSSALFGVYGLRRHQFSMPGLVWAHSVALAIIGIAVIATGTLLAGRYQQARCEPAPSRVEAPETALDTGTEAARLYCSTPEHCLRWTGTGTVVFAT